MEVQPISQIASLTRNTKNPYIFSQWLGKALNSFPPLDYPTITAPEKQLQ